VDGQPLGEKNPKWLQDDYVKFIRFSQWRIQKTGQGILAFITNHGYSDNPTFRGMRRSLDKTFDEMYVFDLHGNSNTEKVAPDGSKDENVFDIKQGVAIGLMVKLPTQE
jgi:predicted helicase